MKIDTYLQKQQKLLTTQSKRVEPKAHLLYTKVHIFEHCGLSEWHRLISQQLDFEHDVSDDVQMLRVEHLVNVRLWSATCYNMVLFNFFISILILER